MKILALEFSSLQRSVAVVCASAAGVAAHEVVETAAGHTMKPFGMIETALKQAGLEREQIECLALGLGPGSYNGVRAAIALAQGWQLAARAGGLKIVGISSAECIAAQAQADGLHGKISVVLDAQRGEFYLAGYDLGRDRRSETLPLRLATQMEVQARAQAGETLTGPEVLRWFPNGRAVFPHATMLGRLALDRKDFVAAEKLTPIYLRETSFVKAPPPRMVLI